MAGWAGRWYAERGRSVLEIACDESGYEGEKLIGTTTDVFAHASVRLDTEASTSCLAELRDRIRSPAQEYKANHLLRQKHRSVLTWLLGPSAPLAGNAHVYLVDKAYLVLARIIDLLVAEQPAEPMARTLYREGRRGFDPGQWEAFLASANRLLRANDRIDAPTPVDSFFGTVDGLRRAGAGGRADQILGLFQRARPRATAFRARPVDHPRTAPTLDPLVPAIIRAVAGWGGGGEPVAIVHDRQNTLSADRIAQLTETLGTRLAGLRFVGSRSDPRVQVADILAGVARKIASDELNGQGDPQLTALLRPYLDPLSIWGDDRSWSRLVPGSGSQP
ncbi:MAG: hypothetical protein GEV12_08020 [Micromonosporaceae bacterium]|nr:hypothetical protein [Micromonosporaceae bacterium]